MFSARFLAVVVVLITLGGSTLLYAQSREDSSRFDPRESVKRMDRNGDGRIDPQEVPMYMRRYVDHAAEEAGLDVKQPLPVDQLSEAMAKRSERRSREGDGGRSSEGDRNRSDRGSEGRSSEGRGDSGGSMREGERSSSSGSPSKPSSLVPGFGDDPKLAKPPGFDVKPNYAAAAHNSAGASSTASFGAGGGSSSASGSSDRGKLRRYAESLMKQYDTNNNGVLEKNEWDKMSGSPKKADGNNDDSLTLEELTDHVARLSGAGPETAVASTGGSTTSGSSPGGSSSRGDRDRERGDDRGRSSSGSSDSKPLARFLTPTERLPKGLPDWFVRNDADGDGQIAMSEFTTAWSNDKAGEFVKFDRDGDGFVTPVECLVVEKERKR